MSDTIVIKTKNFRSHSNRKFVIPSKGLVLLTGQSGTGKTTILNAIKYALYGKVKKPYSFGTKTCSVILTIFGMEIHRSSSPTKLVLIISGNQYESDEAQEIIDKVLGMNGDIFSISSHVVERKFNSLLFLTPLEKLKIIELLTFNDSDHVRVKEAAHCLTKSLERERDHVRGMIETFESEMGSNNIIDDDCTLDLSLEETNIEKDKIDLDIRERLNTISEIKVNIDNLSKKVKDVEIIERFNVDALRKRRDLEIEIQHLENGLSDLVSHDINSLMENISQLKEEISHILTRHKLIDDVERLQRIYNEEVLKREQEILEIRKDMISEEEYATLQEECKTISKNLDMYKYATIEYNKHAENIYISKKEISKIFSDIFDTLGRNDITKCSDMIKYLTLTRDIVKGDIDSLNSKIMDIERTKDLFKCPNCDASLRFMEDGSLIMHDSINTLPNIEDLDTFSDELRAKEITINMINEEWLPRLSTLLPIVTKKHIKPTKPDTSKLDLLNTQTSLRKDLASIREVPSYLSRDISSLRAKLDKIPMIHDQDLEQLKAKLEHLQKEQFVYEDNNKRCTVAKKKRLELDRIKLRDVETPSDVVRNDIEKLNCEISKINDFVWKLNSRKTELDKHIDYLRRKDMRTKHDKALQKLENVECRLRGCIGLEKCIKEAELVSISNTIDAINSHASAYISKMFDEPIIVELYTDSKNVHLKVQYRGNTYADIDELSAGEKQRCELSFILAVNDMVNSPILMLDECLNNLDAQINIDMLTRLRELNTDKLILTVGHETVEGIFDKVIHV